MSNPFAAALSQLQVSAPSTPAKLIPQASPVSALAHSWQSMKQAAWTASSIELECIDKIQQTMNVVSLVFRPLQPQLFIFKPGQFVTISVAIAGKNYHRSYSISSSPSAPLTLELTIKKVDNGKVSNYLVDEFAIGDCIRVSQPLGNFNLIDINADKYLFISAGCGITPMMSMATFLTDSQVSADVAFVHCAQAPDDIIFNDRLRHWLSPKSHAGLNSQRNDYQRSLSFVLEHGLESVSEQGMRDDDGIHWGYGRISLKHLQAAVSDYRERSILVCGPAGFMQALQSMLHYVGFDMARFHQESFMPATESAPTLTADGINPNPVVKLMSQDASVQLHQGDLLLDGIESLGLPIIAACRSGVCGSCKCKVIAGEVAQSSTAPLSEAEINDGLVLACSSRLLTDVTIALV
ncbi:hybrid-cluster NAD(P)-dependent oxidoreductase [Shewanella sp. SNU WT4]|uniref:hybrid-cluster NAD(P)-dependent oxidoreductase n=1 Tax=Shewanella sp. SNU WT4 TaxID=2590015 RepID=UPI001126B94F|nr:hybrid-cluster NAD(P)-dependent oxidoreductase [Shewanella sp. SNU WT4]QDF66329.1 hybrid-cluster NAD(P)-dependent oxidoreductase [Shewanella sp. SNU WT4]